MLEKSRAVCAGRRVCVFSVKLASRLRFSLAVFAALILAFAATPASAVIAYVQGGSFNDGNSYSTVSQTFAGAQTAGNLIVVAIGWIDSGVSVTSISDSRGNTYALAVGPTPYGGQAAQALYYAKNIQAAAAGSNTVTVTFSQAVIWPSFRIVEYSGVDTINPLDTAVGATGESGTSSVTAVTTNANNVLVATNYVASTTAAPGAGFTQRLLTAGGEIVEDRIVSSAGSYTASATLSASGWWIMQVAAFKAAGSSSDTTPPTAPGSLTVTPVSSSQIDLAWTASTDNVAVASYRVERCQGASCSGYAQIAAPVINSYSDTNLSPATSYSYRVRAADAALLFSGYSNGSFAATPAAPTGPSTVVYEYDELGRLKTVTDDVGKLAQFGLDPAGNRLSRTTTNQSASAGFLQFSSAGYGVSEAKGSLQISVIRGGGRVGAAAVNYSAASGTATAGTDFSLAPGTLNWQNGEGGEKTFTVSIANDTFPDGGESFTVSLTGASGATLGAPSSVAVALNDDDLPDTLRPSKPGGLTGSAPGSAQVNLIWNASTDSGGSGLAGYKVFRTQGTNTVQVGTTSSASYIDTTTSGMTAYSYRVSAYDNAVPPNVSDLSDPVSITTPDTIAPTAPTGLEVTAIAFNRVDLRWNASNDPGGSGIWYYIVNGTPGSSSGGTTADTFFSSLPVLQPSTQYTYTVQAVDHSGQVSGLSNQVTPTTLPAPPMDPPGAPSWSGGWEACTSFCETGDSAVLTWNNGSGDAPISWEVYVSADNGQTWSQWSAPFTQSALVTIPFNAVRRFRVRACNLSGCGGYSPVIALYYNPNP